MHKIKSISTSNIRKPKRITHLPNIARPKEAIPKNDSKGAKGGKQSGISKHKSLNQCDPLIM